jgi:2-polyprenyl-6-methoxyphenol hydroxylase-like FAD-dependent oxidoreductase
MTEAKEPILVVGAGPVGLLMASELRRHGVECRLVEKAERPGDKSRAIAVHSRTLEVLDALGLADELIARGVKAHGSSIYANGKRIAGINFDELDAPFPFVLAVPQTDTEAVLRAHLERLGGAVEWRTELTKLELEESGATFELRHGDGRIEKGRTPWILGCDGAHSTLRKSLGFTFEGAPYPETIILGDVKLHPAPPEDEVRVFLSESANILVAPLPGGRARVIGTLPGDVACPEGEPQLSELQSLVDAHVVDRPRCDDCVWLSRFRVHHRIASGFRKGRAFLVGDAAHIHSPAGGQGMNTGLQDGWNLAWKLALVVKGRAPDSLLESYERERRPVAELVVRGTDATMRVMSLRHSLARALRDRALAFLTSFDVVQERIARTASGLGIDYRGSPIVREYRASVLDATVSRDSSSERPSVVDWRDFGAGPVPGTRAPDEAVTLEGSGGTARLRHLLRGTCHRLLLFDGRASTAAGYRNLETIGARMRERWPGLVATHIVVPASARPPELRWPGEILLDPSAHLHHRYGAGSECLYLIRPDGYVGYRSQPARLDGLTSYLERLFSPR